MVYMARTEAETGNPDKLNLLLMTVYLINISTNRGNAAGSNPDGVIGIFH